MAILLSGTLKYFHELKALFFEKNLWLLQGSALASLDRPVPKTLLSRQYESSYDKT